MGHKAWYMSSWGNVGWETREGDTPEVNYPAFDKLFCKYGVDLYLSGHVHLYQRFYPMNAPDTMRFGAQPRDVDMESVSDDGHTYTNPMWYPTLIVASPGDDEISARATCPGLGKTLFRTSQAECTAGYGYGHLTVANATHVHWEFFQT